MTILNNHKLTGSIATGEIKLIMPKFKPLNKNNEGSGELKYMDKEFAEWMKEDIDKEGEDN